MTRPRVVFAVVFAALAGVFTPASTICAAGEPEPQAPESLAAMWLTRVALADLRMVAPPKERDYRLTAEMLEIAKSLTPNDEVITRYLLEAQENAGNQQRVNELTKELIRLDPKDTVSWLRLITVRIRQLQKVDERLAAYDRLLGKDGESLDPSVRSRLALDAALLARENGDAPGFATRLSRAIELDATNKDAATLALTFFIQRVNDPVGKLELMLGVLNADPIDSDTHLAIARHLSASGAFVGASRFFKTTDGLSGRLGVQLSLDDDIERRVVDWHIKGARAVIDELERELSDARAKFAKARADAEDSKQPTDGIPQPNEISLSMSHLWLWLMAAHAMGEDDLVRPALEELIESSHHEITQLAKPEERGKDISDEEAIDRTRGLREETVAARLWAGRELDKAAQELDVLRGDPAADPVKLRRLEGLAKLRAGELDAATSVLTALGPDDDVAQLWLCLVEEARGDKTATALKYRQFARGHMGTLLGAYASTRAERLAGKAPVDPQVQKLEQVAAAVPGWLESIIDSPRKFETLQVKVAPLEARMMDPVVMEIVVRNISRVPLGVGPDRTIDSRLLIAPNVQIATTPMRTAEMVQVASLDRRLRLNPSEEMKIKVWPDVGQMGMTLDEAYSKPVRVLYQVLQGFELDPKAEIYRPGPFCLNADAGPVIRATSTRASADVAAITRWAESGTPRELLESITLMRGRDRKLGNGPPLTADEQKAVFSAIAKRFDKLEPAWQVAIMCAAPTGAISPRVQPMDEPAVLPLEEAARASANQDVRKILLALRTSKADDLKPFETEPAFAALAEIVRSRLADGTPCYATFVPVRESSATPEKSGLATPSDK